MIAKDLSGCRFGRWTILSRAGKTNHREVLWDCLCDCGVRRAVKAGSLRSGESKSCGCLHKEIVSANCVKRLTIHGETAGKNSRVYRIWANMHSRCGNPKFDSYPYYGGRGIKVCKEWGSFSQFLKDMGKPEDGQSIDRYPDGNGDYEPGNCRWASKKEQMNNTRNNIWLEIDGSKKTISQWADEPGAVPRKTIYSRIMKNWEHKDAVFMPLLKRKRGPDGQLIETFRARREPTTGV